MGSSARGLLALSCVLLTIVVNARAPSDTAFNYQSWKYNLKGEVLVLDIGSLWYIGPHPMEPAINSADQCQAACMKVAGCNAWTFCGNKDGCGSGCKSWKDKKSNLVLIKDSPWVDLKAVKLPIHVFGPGNGGGDCSYKNTDKWGYGLCTLKRVSNTASPHFWSKDENEGFVSGTINIPQATCGGTSYNVCYGCVLAGSYNNKDKERCFACAKSLDEGRVFLDRSTAPADRCPTCFKGLGAFKDRCLNCIMKKEPCAMCLTQKFIKQCLECYKNEGPKEDYNYCTRCTDGYDLKDEAQVIRCVHKCLPAIRSKRCKTPDQKSPACISDYNNVCPYCSKSAKNYAACVKCATTFPAFEGKCTTCIGMVEGEDKQAECLKCASKPSVTDNYKCTGQ